MKIILIFINSLVYTSFESLTTTICLRPIALKSLKILGNDAI